MSTMYGLPPLAMLLLAGPVYAAAAIIIQAGCTISAKYINNQHRPILNMLGLRDKGLQMGNNENKKLAEVLKEALRHFPNYLPSGEIQAQLRNLLSEGEPILPR